MTTLQLTVTLPDELVNSVEPKGLLAHDRLSALLQRALEQEDAIYRLFETADALATLEPPLTPEEIDLEVKAVRRQRAHRS
mgnify:CR=1 FL=1